MAERILNIALRKNMRHLLDVDAYKVLYEADYILNGKVSLVLSNAGSGSLTICPLCHVDDFIHAEDCPLQNCLDHL
jgi:hypothetical protein